MRLLKFLFLSFFIFTLLISIIPTPVFAEEQVKLNVNPGFGGEYKASEWVPIRVTITNDSGKDINGNVVTETVGNNEYSGVYYQPVSVAKNTTKEVALLVPGTDLYPSSSIKLLDENNQEIVKAKVGGRNYSNNFFLIGVLASDKDTGYFLSSISSTQNQMKIVPLAQENLPSTRMALKGLDALLINNYSLDMLTDKQLEAITNWTKQGGLLILGGGSSYQKTINRLSEVSPVEINGTTQINTLKSLEGEAKREIPFQKPITISKATVKNGEVVYQENNIPIVVLNKLEAGHVMYVAYDLADEPMASWSGNKDMWNKLFADIYPSANITNPKVGVYPINGNWWSLRTASERIPSLKLPEPFSLLLLFFGYLLLVGPILYFILKKLGKRELNWFIVPVLSLILAFSIFQFSSINRGNKLMVNNVGYLNLSSDVQPTLKGMSAIFVPTGGDYHMTYKNLDMLLPINDQNKPQGTWLAVNPDISDVRFHDVDYWSFRRVYVEKTISDIGDFDSSLSYTNGRLVGSITNNSNISLRDVKLVLGKRIIDVGDLKTGKETKIDTSFSASQFLNQNRGPSVNISSLLPNNIQTSQYRYNSREQYLLELLNQEWYQTNSFNEPTLIGWTEDSLIDFDVKDENHEDYQLTLVRSNLKLIPATDGTLFYPPGMIKSKLIASPDNTQYYPEMGYRFQAGNLKFEFDLGNIEKIDIDKINFYIWSQEGKYYTEEIFNWKKDKYEPFTSALTNYTLQGDAIKDYVSSNGKIKINIHHDTINRYRQLGDPAISVEGKVTD